MNSSRLLRIDETQVGSDGLLVAWSPPGQDEVGIHFCREIELFQNKTKIQLLPLTIMATPGDRLPDLQWFSSSSARAQRLAHQGAAAW